MFTWAIFCFSSLSFAAASGPEISDSGQSDARPTVVTQETVVGKLPAEAENIVVSSDGRHIACIVKRGDGQVVERDQMPGQVYGRIVPHTLAFSPDSQRFGYLAERDKRQFAVIDGVEGPSFEELPAIPPIWSPDGKRVATAGSRKGKRSVVLDGVEGPEFDAVYFDSLAFSPDSKRVAYAARKQGKCVVVVDGKPTDPFDTAMAVDTSPDGKYVVYASGDGQEGIAPLLVFNPSWTEKDVNAFKYSVVPFLAFSPDSKHVAYIARDKKEVFFVLDGVAERKGFNGILLHNKTSPFQPVNRLRARERDGAYGITLPDSVSPFSPDGKRLGYIAMRYETARKQSIMSCVVVDGKETAEPYFSIDLHFSPDSQRIAYVHVASSGQEIVVDGTPYRHDGVPWETLCFSPDSKHASYIARTGKEHSRTSDGKTGKSYGELLGFGSFTFSPDAARTMEIIARKDGSMSSVIDGVEGKAYARITPVGFTANSKHAAYFATSVTGSYLVVDGEQGKRFDEILFGDCRFESSGTICYFGLNHSTRELTRIVTRLDD